MTYYIYAHDQGTVDFVDSHGTKAAAIAHASRLKAEFDRHPSWFDFASPWFEISTVPPYQPTYTFPDMSGMG
jgi:hypothetical protein